MTRSSAAWKSRVRIVSRWSRPAKIAASLQMLARSAPVRLLVWRAMMSRSTPLLERLAAGVHVEDRAPSLQVGRRHEDLAVEAPGAQQRRIELLEQVGGGDHHHVVAAVEAVELDQQLVERLVLLPRDVLAAGGAHRVELVDEDDRRRLLAGLAEQPADAGGAEPGEHLDERRGRLGEELGLGLVGDRLGQQRLAGARAGRAAGCPWAPWRPALRKRLGSRRNSTTSRSSSLASSTPATSCQRTELDDCGLISCGLVRGR